MKRFIFWLLFVLFALAIVWWILYVPYQPDKLLRAIPNQAEFVTLHDNPAARWSELSSNPVIQSLLVSAGAEPRQSATPASNTAFDTALPPALKPLLGNKIALAYCPSIPGIAAGTWYFSSWLGWEERRLRWLLGISPPKYVTHIDSRAGRSLWFVPGKRIGLDVPLHFALADGMIIGCLSASKMPLIYMLDTLDGRRPSIQPLGQRLFKESSCVTGNEPDKGWFHLSGQHENIYWVYGLSDIRHNLLHGEFCFPSSTRTKPPELNPASFSPLLRLLGELPVATIIFSLESLAGRLRDVFPFAWSTTLNRLLRMSGGDTIFLAMLGEDYCGRFKRVKVPGFVAGIQMEEGSQPVEIAGNMIDYLNGKNRWGLVPRKVESGDGEIFGIESTSRNFYSEMETREHVAFGARDGWLLVGSNVDTLDKFVTHYDAGEPQSSNARQPAWMRSLPHLPCTGFAWIDLDSGARMLRLALAAYSLKLVLDDPSESQEVRQKMNEAKAWIEALAPLDDACLWLQSRDIGERVILELGEPQY